MEDVKVPSGNPQDPVDQKADNKDVSKDVVSYDSHRKLLGEKKKVQEELEKLQARLAQVEEEKLKESGKFKELYERESKEKLTLAQQLEATEGKFAYKVLSSQLEQEALKQGCVDPKALLELYKKDLIELEPDADFNVDGEKLKSFVDRATKEKSYLFKKSAPSVAGGLPSTAQPQGKITLNDAFKKLAEVSLKQHKI